MAATHSNLALLEPMHSPIRHPGEIELDTRFGRVAVDESAIIRMPQGPHGFGNRRAFVLMNVPEAEDQPFKLYQSIEDSQLSFIVLPLAAPDGESGAPIAESDLAEACRTYDIPRDDAAFLLIVTMRRDEAGQVGMTANLRAPLVLDTVNRVARQHIFVSTDYPMRQPL